MAQKEPPRRGVIVNLARAYLVRSNFFPVKCSDDKVTNTNSSEIQVSESSTPSETKIDDWKWMFEEISRRRLAFWVMLLMVLRYAILLVILLIPGTPIVDKILELLVSDRVLDWAFKEMIRHSFPGQKN